MPDYARRLGSPLLARILHLGGPAAEELSAVAQRSMRVEQQPHKFQMKCVESLHLRTGENMHRETLERMSELTLQKYGQM